jgi:hypothetical protein
MSTSLSFLDLVKANSRDVVGEIIDENTRFTPELDVFDTESLAPGLMNYQTLHRIGQPSVSFAKGGEGFTPSKSELKLVNHELFRFGGRIEAPRNIADNWSRGGAGGYQALEAAGVMRAAMELIGTQIFYGDTASGDGFDGLKKFTPHGWSYAHNATGTTASTASSVYYVQFGQPYVQMITGQAMNGNGLMDLPDFRIGDMTDANGKLMEAYISELSSYVGLQIAAPWSVLRIYNITADSGKGLTDALIAAAKEKMPVGFAPDACFMSRRSRFQLQTSRTVTLFGSGTVRPDQGLIAPMPMTDADGVRIIATDSILNTDAIES